MNQDKYVFAQLTAFLNRTQFNNYVRKYDGNRYVKHFTCWNQLLAMMFGQLSNRESLRDLIVAFEAHRAKQYHLGLGHDLIAKTTLASANQNRDYRIFEDFAFFMMKEACEKRATNILDIPGKKYAFDSTTIPLCLATFPWAKFRRNKGGVKTNLKYKIVKWKRRMPMNVLSDAVVKLTGYLSEKKYPESFRLIRYYDAEDNREFTFLTNARHLSALEVADLYKKDGWSNYSSNGSNNTLR